MDISTALLGASSCEVTMLSTQGICGPGGSMVICRLEGWWFDSSCLQQTSSDNEADPQTVPCVSVQMSVYV